MVLHQEKDANVWKPPDIDKQEVEEVKKFSSPAHQVSAGFTMRSVDRTGRHMHPTFREKRQIFITYPTFKVYLRAYKWVAHGIGGVCGPYLCINSHNLLSQLM